MALTQTLWIGGGTSAGKTSIARALAERYGVTPYHVDEHELEHARRRDRSRDPAMEAWDARSLDEIWVELPVPDLVEATLAYSRERIELITEDLQALSAGRVCPRRRRGRCRIGRPIQSVRRSTASSATRSWSNVFGNRHGCTVCA